MKLLYFCNHDPLWLDAYDVWRCEICHPPILAAEVRERKNSKSEKSAAEISPAENFPDSPDEEIPNVNFVPRYFLNDEFLWLPDNPANQEPPCDACGSLAFWWNILGGRHCQRCTPRPKRSRELLELVPKLRETAERARLAEAARLAKLAKLDSTAKK